MFKVQNYIDGKFQDALSGKWLDNYEPATGKVYSHVADSDETDLQLAYQAAKKAFATWSKLTKETRASYLNKIADGIEKRFDEFAAAEAKDTGKPLTLAKNMDISRAIANFRYVADPPSCIHLQSVKLTIVDFSLAPSYTTKRCQPRWTAWPLITQSDSQ
jgi:aminomuconate-semialdehyde/2-hydroxymuconate-6-semialdehyde dehydrogenase